MKFNYIIGNPPYQTRDKTSDSSSLYIDITKKCLDLLTDDGVIDFLTPSTIAQVKRQRFTLSSIKGLKLIDYRANQYFRVGVKIIRWVIDKTYTGKVTVIDEDGYIEDRLYTDLMVQSKDKFAFDLFEKIKNNKNKLFIQERLHNRTLTKTDEYKYKIIVNKLTNKIEYSKVKPKLYKRKKIVIHAGAVYDERNFEISTEDFNQYQNLIDITDCSEEEIQNIKSFLFNPISINICKKSRILYNTGINSILYCFPKIDYTKLYTNKEVQEAFNLTNEEAQYLLR